MTLNSWMLQLSCMELELYGVTTNFFKWFQSFLTNRTQRVRIEEVLSDLENLLSGVPQGGNIPVNKQVTLNQLY